MKYLLLAIIIGLSACSNDNDDNFNKAMLYDHYDKSVFVTSEQYTPLEIGGILQADGICNQHASSNNALTGKYFVAYVSAPGMDVVNRLNYLPAGSYSRNLFYTTADEYLVKAQRFVFNENGHLIDNDENGNTVDLSGGVYFNNTFIGESEPYSACLEFTSESSSEHITIKKLNPSLELSTQVAACDSANHHLYCVEN